LLVDVRGVVLSSGSAPLGQRHPRPGWVEQSGDEIWASVCAAAGQCRAQRPDVEVLAVAFSTQRESMILWDRHTGDAVSPVISWQDRRTADRCAAIAASGNADAVQQITGLPVDPMFSATKAGWLLDAYDPDRRRSRAGELCLGTVDAWLLSQFADEPVIEAGNASRTQLLDARTLEWHDDLLTLFGVPREVLPRVVSSLGPFPVARQLPGVADGTPVGAVLADSHAALYAQAGPAPGTVKATYGTGSSVMALCAATAEVPPGLCLTVAWQTDAIAFALEGNIRSSGATLAWLARLVDRTPVELAELAATATSDGLHFVPAFNGLGAPWWDDRAQAILVGMSLGTDLSQLARAALESIAFQIEDVVAAIDSVAPVNMLAADGGASANDVLMQLQADISGRTVRQSGQADLSSLGAARLALRALDPSSDVAPPDIAGRTFTPTDDATARAARQHAWHSAVARARLQH
jgi:glycerol kinase